MIPNLGALLNTRTKQLLMGLGTLFVALAFVSSILAYGNNNAQTSATTSIAAVKTYFVAGSVNAIVSGYGSTASITVSNQIANGTAIIGNVLSNLQSNGSISNYLVQTNSFQVFLAKMNPYQLQTLVDGAVNSSGLNFTASTYVTLPKAIKLYYNTQAIPVYPQQLNYSESITPLPSLGSNISVNVQALVVANGTIFDNNIKVITS